MQGPEIWLKDLGLTVPCVVDPDRDAVLDVEHRVFVNAATFFLSDAAAREAFLAAPWRFTGPLTDPVAGDRFTPTEASPRREHAGRLFFFASAATAEAFDADPDAHATPVVPYAGRM